MYFGGTKRSFLNSEDRSYLARDQSLQDHIEAHRIVLAGGVNAEVDHPPAAHLEFHALDQVVAVAQLLGDLRLRWQPVAVLRHIAIDSDRRGGHGPSIRHFDMQLP